MAKRYSFVRNGFLIHRFISSGVTDRGSYPTFQCHTYHLFTVFRRLHSYEHRHIFVNCNQFNRGKCTHCIIFNCDKNMLGPKIPCSYSPDDYRLDKYSLQLIYMLKVSTGNEKTLTQVLYSCKINVAFITLSSLEFRW